MKNTKRLHYDEIDRLKEALNESAFMWFQVLSGMSGMFGRPGKTLEEDAMEQLPVWAKQVESRLNDVLSPEEMDKYFYARPKWHSDKP